MAGVRIVTDSASDLTAEQAAANGVEVVPLTIRFGEEEFTDGGTLSIEEFYRRLATSPELPETAAPSVGAFETAFRRHADAGAEAIVCLNISSLLSATMQSAQNAAKSLEGEVDVRVIDSRSLTSGLGSQVLAAARAAADGKGVDDVVAIVEDMIPRTHVYGALDTLENLKKGGRIGGAQAMVGTLLSIKPILDVSTGEVQEASKQRTRKKSLLWLRDKVFEQPSVENLAVMHGQAPDIDEFLDLLAPRYPADSISVGLIGPTIGTHGGPRVMGVTFQSAR